MILTRQQEDVLQDLRGDMAEVIMATTAHDWDDVKDRLCGLTFGMVLDWLNKLESVVGKPVAN